ncbi:uncharacterized protein BDV14DRAFT_205748 [Aspergillus stella-maris]|uniref:uncharacterized protein n=1 Tax=Aspergillus stella-maris TaxID=1810926 RepID=UPI003CCD9557
MAHVVDILLLLPLGLVLLGGVGLVKSAMVVESLLVYAWFIILMLMISVIAVRLSGGCSPSPGADGCPSASVDIERTAESCASAAPPKQIGQDTVSTFGESQPLLSRSEEHPPSFSSYATFCYQADGKLAAVVNGTSESEDDQTICISPGSSV